MRGTPLLVGEVTGGEGVAIFGVVRVTSSSCIRRVGIIILIILLVLADLSVVDSIKLRNRVSSVVAVDIVSEITGIGKISCVFS